MRFSKWILAICCLPILGAWLHACPAGYESPESLVRHARLIVQLEVLSVEEAPLPPDVSIRDGNDDYGRKFGQARVRILEVIKGECAVREFTLIGGPFHTCAPSLYYHAFEVGEKPVLILESPLPKDVKMVAITWRNRLLIESVHHIKDLMEKAREGWKLAVQRHRRAAPEEMAQAEVLRAEFIKNPAYKAPSKASFGVLSCLAILSNDPDDLPDEETEEPDDQDRWSGYSNSFFASFYASKGAYVTAYGSNSVIPAGMRAVFPTRNDFNYTPPPEARQFNERILKTILEDELFVPPALSATILGNPKLKVMWDQPQRDPFWLTLDRPPRSGEALDAMALYFLMLLAHPEPDGLVWGGHGMSADQDAVFLPPDLFIGFLGHNQKRFFEHSGANMILLLLPHPQVAPIVRAHVTKGAYDNRPVVLIRYFALLGLEPDVLNAVGIMEKSVDQFIQSLTKPERGTSMVEYEREHYLNETKNALKGLGPPGSFKAAEQRLRVLSARITAAKVRTL